MLPLLLWAAAALMAVVTAWVLKRGSAVKTLSEAGLVLFLLAMMASMFVSATAYLYFPGFLTLFELVALNMISMSVALIPVLMALFNGDRQLDETMKGGPVSSRSIVFGAMIALAMLSEVFMGWAFGISSGVAPTQEGVFASLVGSASSYWFVFTMAAEMAVTLYLVGRNFPRTFRWLVAIQIAIMVLSPTAIVNSTWTTDTLVGGSAVMILAIIVIFDYIFKNRSLADGASKYVVSLIGAYGMMMAGLFLWLMDGDALLYVLSIVVEMAVYFTIVLDGERLTAPPLVGWQTKPLWVFALLGGMFVAEFFMGGTLDVLALGTTYFTNLPFGAITGAPLTMVGAALYDFIVAVGSVTGSFWFLVMMGIEMGSLVVFKVKYAREMETKIRLLLVVVAYAVYTLFLPVFVLSASLPKIPWIGWSMGLGTAGGLAPGAVILALLGTYLISGGLSFFFGSRQVCSLFCTAALMYQGTTYDAMSSFNRTSKIGRHLLTSRISNAYKVVVSLVWVSLIGSAVLSYLTSVGVISVSIFGADPSYFFYAFYFNFLWYAVWLMVPFVGTYGCATTGMCGWGSFNQLVSRFGIFRLKVRDGDVCSSCKTKDCAKVCPVGLTDMPGAFIEKGEFRSFKCIGVGDCVSACPYNNVIFFDVRNWVRMKLGRPIPALASPLSYGGSEAPIDFRAAGKEMK